MRLQIDIHSTWLNRPEVLARVMVHLRTLEAAAPMPSAREPGDDDGDGDDLGELLAGMAEADTPAPVPSAPPTAIPMPSAAPATPTTGSELYKWAVNNKALPHAASIGKARGYPRLIKSWDARQVVVAFRELAAGHSE